MPQPSSEQHFSQWPNSLKSMDFSKWQSRIYSSTDRNPGLQTMKIYLVLDARVGLVEDLAWASEFRVWGLGFGV